MRADRRQHARTDDPVQVLLDSGLVDPDFVGAQLGRSFGSVEEAARAVVDAGDISPHPLFEGTWLSRKKSWQRSGQHPVVWYVAERRRRNRLAPHPLVEPRTILAAHPEARFHEYGALAHWLSVATADSPLPTRLLPRKVTWGDYRAAAIAAAGAWREDVVRRRPAPDRPTGEVPAVTDSPAVTVVMVCQDEGPLLRATVESLQAQGFAGWELVAVDMGSHDDTAAVLTGLAAFDDRITVVHEGRSTTGRCLNSALEHGTGEHVAFLQPGRSWSPDHLARLLAHARAHGLATVQTGGGPVARSREELLAGRPVDLVTTLLRRDAIKDVGGFDESLGGAVGRDLVLRLTRQHELHPLDVATMRRPEPPRGGTGDDWDSLVLERQLVDWEAVRARETDPDLVSYVLPLGQEPRRTVEWFSVLPPTGVELVAVGVRLKRAHHLLAAALATVLPNARFVPVAADLSLSAAANVGAAQVRGATVVIARPEAMPPRGPLTAPLCAALAEPDVAVAQPLVVALDGTVLSAGARFSATHTHPGLLLAGHPAADAVRLGRCTIAAPASPVVAVSTRTLADLRGLDPRFHSVLAETDLGLRAHAAGAGRTVLVPDAVITSRTPYATPQELIGGLASLAHEQVAPPPDGSVELLAVAGFEVTDHRSRRVSVDPDDPQADAVLLPEPVVRAVDGIHEQPPRLRWAIDIAAPAAARGDKWGDSYFAGSLAAALQRRGQHVAVDRRDARDRDSRDHDDVLLVLRGLDRVAPRPGLLNLEWIISHPDMVTPAEVAGFDAVYAASLSWSDRVSRDWGIAVTPLLQCTDVRLFHPDRAEPDTGPQVLFVGNSRGVYRFAVRSALAIGASLELHGRDWGEFVPREWITSGGVANEELGGLYASAGVVLNDHHLDMRRDSFASNRLFDAAACGARIASDPIEGLQEIFGGLVQTFRDESELARLVEPPYPAFPDAATRREIATRVVAEHSFDRRAETLVDDAVRRLLARRR